jgi:hypothetical protein
MMKSFLEDAVSAAWDQVVERARLQGPEALRKAELLRRRADLLREHAFPLSPKKNHPSGGTPSRGFPSFSPE